VVHAHARVDSLGRVEDGQPNETRANPWPATCRQMPRYVLFGVFAGLVEALRVHWMVSITGLNPGSLTHSAVAGAVCEAT
jgi:hypothetical protein